MSTEKNPSLSFRSLIQSMSVISAGTLASRILGFFRDIILAKFFGTGFRADVFFVAFRIPNLFRDLVGEGAANSAVVPVLSERLQQEEREKFWRFVSIVLVLALVVLGFITLAGILLAPLIVRLLAPGFISSPDKLLLAVHLTKIVFPYLIFIGLTSYSMAVLYTFRKFAVPAFSPCLLNIAIIISALLSVRFLKEPVYGLAAGVLIGGLLQLAVQIPPLFKIGYSFQKPSSVRQPGVVQIGKLLIPRLIGGGIYQLTTFIDTFCASLALIVGAGGISAIYYSNRLIRLPMGVFSLALASAVLPVLSTLVAKKDIEQLRRTVVFSLENILFVMAPFSVIMMVLSEPIIRILFQRGEFDAYSTAITSSALLFYSIGLFAFGGIKILV
ncbi:MAG: murein biosynthesis integral membrane protein MurJ, partial [Candidatus Omnitrophota bacterium]